ncbi:glycoside hydrolase N-terminal domain-containing protein [Planctomycetota bacterium]
MEKRRKILHGGSKNKHYRMSKVAIVIILVFSFTSAGATNKEIGFDGNKLSVDTEKYLSQHDVVYLTPATEGYEGFPIGNGDLGAMGWTPTDRLHFQINKTDTWDDGPDKSFSAWDDSHLANQYTALRHCGELHIEPGLRTFDWMYLEDFQGRLSLSDAKATWFAKGPLGKVNCSAFVAKNPKVLVINYEDELSESTTRNVKLARWGTKAFEHWYAMVKRSDYLGPEGTKTGARNDEIWIIQPMRTLEFAMVCKIVVDNPATKIYHSRQVGFEVSSGRKCSFTLYLSVVTSEEAKDPLAAARDNVRKAAKLGAKSVYTGHKAFWDNFWSKSFIDIPDKYIENLWYLNLYQIGSSSAGRYPPHFIQSIWSWTRDARPWNHYYHWNQQSYTWPLMASGHPELLEPYAKWRLEGLPRAIEDARKVHNCSGAFYSDVANRKGYQDVVDPVSIEKTIDSEWLDIYYVLVNYNITPGAQIAHDLYRHYQYTGDEEFMKKYTYPIMREWVRFMIDYVKLEDDGRYHVPIADPYEAPEVRCKDTTNALAYVHLLFPALAQLADKMDIDGEIAAKASEVEARLADYNYVKLTADMETVRELPVGAPLISAGVTVDTGEPVLGGYGGLYECAALTPVFPTGLVNLDKKETREFQAAHNFLNYNDDEGVGHNYQMVCAARLGMADLMEEKLRYWADTYQVLPQGFFCYYNRDHPQFYNITATNRAKVVGKEEYVEVPAIPFCHMALEAGSIFETALNDMLLGGYTEKIRVFPATPKHWDARFTLHAMGGFVVTSEKQGDNVIYLAVESKLGNDCCVINPWGEKQRVSVVDVTNGSKISPSSGSEITFSTKKGHVYVLETVDSPLSSYQQKKLTAEPNRASKKLRRATLGKPRQF